MATSQAKTQPPANSHFFSGAPTLPGAPEANNATSSSIQQKSIAKRKPTIPKSVNAPIGLGHGKAGRDCDRLSAVGDQQSEQATGINRNPLNATSIKRVVPAKAHPANSRAE